jgi:hypothetical protein
VDKDSVYANGVNKHLDVDQMVHVPFYGIYIPAQVIAFYDGYVKVKSQVIDRIDTLTVPLLDVCVD